MLLHVMVLVAAMLPASVLHDNGPVVNSPATGYGGADESRCQDTSLGMNTLGFNHQTTGVFVIADDFEVPTCGWTVSAVLFFAYQTNAPTSPSTITEVRFEIFDDVPGSPGADVVYGDLTTNRLTSSEWLQCYRVYETTSGNNARPIMLNRCDLPTPVTLGPGVYWIAWKSGGSLASGPFAPPISITGETTTGNALQFNGSVWAQAADGVTHTQQGFPFLLEGAPSPVEPTTWGSVKAMFR
ncbi:MAG: hypothetical protein FJY74_03245 [Candidatus Eisenbacteria bacterium]|nr:hypothetical protein [Candidatus Eisenbacteria bacterium]